MGPETGVIVAGAMLAWAWRPRPRFPNRDADNRRRHAFRDLEVDLGLERWPFDPGHPFAQPTNDELHRDRIRKLARKSGSPMVPRRHYDGPGRPYVDYDEEY